jgi:hypothetical protein
MNVESQKNSRVVVLSFLQDEAEPKTKFCSNKNSEDLLN